MNPRWWRRPEYTLLIPIDTQAGEPLLLAMAWRPQTVTVEDPPGWTRTLWMKDQGTCRILWERTAEPTDAGTVVTVQLSGPALVVPFLVTPKSLDMTGETR